MVTLSDLDHCIMMSNVVRVEESELANPCGRVNSVISLRNEGADLSPFIPHGGVLFVTSQQGYFKPRNKIAPLFTFFIGINLLKVIW